MSLFSALRRLLSMRAGMRPGQVAILRLYGPITGGARSADWIESIRRLRDSARVPAVVLDVDSPGGSAPASDYLRTGISLLPPDAWTSHYELALGLHADAAACAYATARFDDGMTPPRQGILPVFSAAGVLSTKKPARQAGLHRPLPPPYDDRTRGPPGRQPCYTDLACLPLPPAATTSPNATWSSCPTRRTRCRRRRC